MYEVAAGQRLITVDDVEVLLFGGARCPLSNFAACDLRWTCSSCGETLRCATVEHAFQAAKCTTCHDAHRVAGAGSPRDARTLGRRVQLRPDWEHPDGLVAGRAVSTKAQVMWELLRQKFSSLEHGVALERTGELVLVEDAPWDGFWGAGKDGHGTNALGRLLMTLRQELRGESPAIASPTPPVPR